MKKAAVPSIVIAVVLLALGLRGESVAVGCLNVSNDRKNTGLKI